MSDGHASDDAPADKARRAAGKSSRPRRRCAASRRGPPEKLEDWPSGKAKYQTYGGPDGTSGYDDGPTSKLGPADLRYHEDGSISVAGDKIDDPEEFRGDPIPGGPTDTGDRSDRG